MSPNPERVRARLAYIAGQTEALRRLFARVSLGELATEERQMERAGVKYAVQTAVEAMMDVAYHLCARQWRHAPVDSHDALDFLGARGVLPQTHLPAWHKLVGTRNRLVHGDLDVSEERFLVETRDGLPDFEAFATAVDVWLAEQRA